MSSTRDVWGLTLLLALCVGCAEPTSEAPASVAPALEPLYLMIHEYRQDYENGIDLIVGGDRITGENVLIAATDRMRVAAELCSSMPDCDPELFARTLEHVAEDRDPGGDHSGEPDAADAEGRDSPLVEAVPEVQRTISLLAEADLRDIVPLNRRVKAAINDWLTWNRPTLMAAYENYQFLRDFMAPIYDEAGLPEALLFAILATETGGKVHAYSRAGAAGPMQFMPHTGRRYGLGSVDGFDMRLDPVAASKASVAYLNDQLKALNGDLELALAAYNVGEGRIRRLHRKHRGAKYWDPQFYYALPTETRRYVPRIFAAALLFLEPERYGLSFLDREVRTTTIVLKEPLSLGELTICLGQERNPDGWFRTLRNLNPRRGSDDRIAAGDTVQMPSMIVSTYADRCVGNSSILALASELHDAAYPERPEIVQYTVRRGDTLARIASRHGCWSVGKLATLNGITGPGYVIHVGQRLTVPVCS
jgi:membrane-bound lytic murein transglycosylase D